MARLVATCPSCAGDLVATRLACEACETALEGRFDLPALLRLKPDDLAFITTFVRESGSLKAMAEHTGTSYPTVRNRLNEIIERLTEAEAHVETRRHAVIDRLERGELSPAAAARELRKLAGGKTS